MCMICYMSMLPSPTVLFINICNVITLTRCFSSLKFEGQGLNVKAAISTTLLRRKCKLHRNIYMYICNAWKRYRWHQRWEASINNVANKAGVHQCGWQAGAAPVSRRRRLGVTSGCLRAHWGLIYHRPCTHTPDGPPINNILLGGYISDQLAEFILGIFQSG